MRALLWHSDPWTARRAVVVGAPPGAADDTAAEQALVSDLLALWRRSAPPWVDRGWAGVPVAAPIARLLDLPAGPELIAALAGSPSCSLAHDEGFADQSSPGRSPGFPCLCRLVVATAWQACLGFAAVGAARAVVAAMGPEPVVVVTPHARVADPSRVELAASLRVSPQSAAGRIARARELVALPVAAELAASGALPVSAVADLCRTTAGLSQQDAHAVAAEIADRVHDRLRKGLRAWTGSDAARAARRCAIACPSWQQARRRAVARRRVGTWANGDGTCTMEAVLPEEAGVRIMRRLTAWARTLAPDGRPIDAVRADLFADVLLGDAVLPATGIEVQVVVGLETLLGLSDAPAEVPGHGPVPADVARELAADARWRAWVTDASGAMAAVGSRTYRPGEALARQVRARDRHCRMPGCRRPAQSCDLDHAQPWPVGRTTAENLGALCRPHHVLKTTGAYRLQTDGRSTRWQMPSGMTVRDEAEVPLAG